MECKCNIHYICRTVGSYILLIQHRVSVIVILVCYVLCFVLPIFCHLSIQHGYNIYRETRCKTGLL